MARVIRNEGKQLPEIYGLEACSFNGFDRQNQFAGGICFPGFLSSEPLGGRAASSMLLPSPAHNPQRLGAGRRRRQIVAPFLGRSMFTFTPSIENTAIPESASAPRWDHCRFMTLQCAPSPRGLQPCVPLLFFQVLH